MLPSNAEVAAKITALMQRHISEDRSTPGEAQRNNSNLSLEGDSTRPNKQTKKTRAGVDESPDQP